MTKSNTEILADCFSVLNAEQLGNFKWHLEDWKGVLCGPRSMMFVHKGKG